MHRNQQVILSSIVLSILLSPLAMAQYIWLNDKGVKQYSDTPPPKSVPKDKIIKTPAGVVRGMENPSSTSTDNKSDTNKLEKPVTLASKNEDFNKRKLAREEAEKKAAAEKQDADAHAKNCERAKAYKQSLDEGSLIMTRNKEGERTVLDETQRSKEAAEVGKVLANCR